MFTLRGLCDMDYCELLYTLLINGSWKMPVLAIAGGMGGLFVFITYSTFIHWKTGSDVEFTIWEFRYRINRGMHDDKQDR